MRTADAGEAASLPPPLRDGKGKLFAVVDPRRPPRWRAVWAEGTEVLAAQVDRLLVDVAVGEGGRAAYQVWAEVRNRGAQQLELALPAGFALVAAGRDGAPVQPGLASGPSRLAVPLAVSEASQVVHLAGVVALALPGGRGELTLPLPSLSAPAARVEVRVVLPGGHSYELADADRQGAVGQPPRPLVAGAAVPELARQVLARPAAGPHLLDPELFPTPAGFTELTAAWSALSAEPAPLAVRVERDREETPWF